MALLGLADGQSQDHRDDLREPLHARGRARPSGRAHPTPMGSTAVIRGVPAYQGAPVMAYRSAAPPPSLVLAGLAAHGTHRDLARLSPGSRLRADGGEAVRLGRPHRRGCTHERGAHAARCPKGRLLDAGAGAPGLAGHRPGCDTGLAPALVTDERARAALHLPQAGRHPHLRAVRRRRSRHRGQGHPRRAGAGRLRAGRPRLRLLPAGGGRAARALGARRSRQVVLGARGDQVPDASPSSTSRSAGSRSR